MLLERIKEERKKNFKGQHKELPLIDTSDLLKLPKNWVWTMLGEILFPSNDKFDPRSSQNERFIGLEHIERGTGRLLGYGKSVGTRSTKTKFRKGDLLYGKLRPYLNKVCVVDFDGVCSTDILVFSKNEFLDNRYIAKYWLGNNFVKYATQHMSGVQHPRVNYQTISSYALPLPPFPEQRKIAEEIERRFSLDDLIARLPRKAQSRQNDCVRAS